MNGRRIRRVFPQHILELLLACCGFVIFGFHARAASDTLVPFQTALWKYWDYGYVPSATWFAPNYVETDWKENSGQFGYGEGDEHTLLSYGLDPQDKYVTAYFRRGFDVSNPAQYSTVTFHMFRDAGVVVYLNGFELFRNNMPDGTIYNSSYASSCLSPLDKQTLVTNIFSGSILQSGSNVLAVEVHQCAPAGATMSFDMEVLGDIDSPVTVTRGPYLQIGTSSNVVVRWRTSAPTSTRVRYGPAADTLNQSVANGIVTTEHEITVPNLAPATKYFYDIGSSAQVLAGDGTYFFMTAPVPGTVQPVRIWAIGDAGTGYPAQLQVRDTYASFTGSRYTDLFLMLGDNAYYSGLDDQYQSYVFDIYQTMLRQTVTWPCVGNHDTDQSQALSDSFPYYDIFTLPRNGEAGGMPSGSEHYYSFDYANIHFVCLDSMTAMYRQPNSSMLTWLQADLANNSRDWIIAYWHHPPYSRGSHNTDLDIESYDVRANLLPILENYGVDLVLSGHSHVYERSYLLDGHYGSSTTINPTNFVDHGNGRTNGTGAYRKAAGGFGERRGAVYIVNGSSGGQGTGGSLDHPAMLYSTYESGSVAIDVNGLRLDVTFIRADGAQPDSFTIDKHVMPMTISRLGTNALMMWPATDVAFGLQSKGSVNPALAWSSNSATILTNDRRKLTVLPIDLGTNQFFQLKRLP